MYLLKLRHPCVLMSTVSNAVASSVPPIDIFYNDVHEVHLPKGHRFPMEKYRLVRQRAQRELAGTGLATFTPSPFASLRDLTTVHDLDYIQRYLTGQITPREARVMGFPWSEENVDRTLSSVGGTVAAMHAVMGPKAGAKRPRAAAHVAGGTHHAFRDRGEGFCIFNDIAVAARVALRDYPEHVSRILLIDLDVHQGNGNAVLFKNEPRVFTFSMHCRANFFSQPQQSDVDVELDPDAGDDAYLDLLQHWLPRLMSQHQPDLIFYQAGVDPSEHDRLGRLALTRQGLQTRNRHVMKAVSEYGKAPLVVTMGGGYPRDSNPASDSYETIIAAHADVYVGLASHFGPGNQTEGDGAGAAEEIR